MGLNRTETALAWATGVPGVYYRVVSFKDKGFPRAANVFEVFTNVYLPSL